MKAIIFFAGVALTFGLAACSTNPISIGSDFNSSIDFDAFTTYRWHEGNEYNIASNLYLSNDIVDQRIRSNVDRELRAKGFYLQQTGPIDFLVNYTVSSQERLNVETYNRYAGYAPGWNHSYGSLGPYHYSGPGFYGGTSVVESRITQYSQGTLVLDIVQPESDILVWRGIAEGKLDQSMDQREREAIIEEAVTRLLGNFPPSER